MINKLTSSVIAATSFSAMASAPSHPDSLLFIFISSNKIVATIRLALALCMLAISFDLVKFGFPPRKFLLRTGLALVAFGIISTVVSPILYWLYDYLKILDILIIMELGVLLSSLAVIPQTAAVRQSAKAKKSLKPRAILRQA